MVRFTSIGRATLEVGVLLAVLGYMAFDYLGRDSQPRTDLSLEGLAPASALDTAPSTRLPIHLRSLRVQPLVAAGVPTIFVCNNYVASTDPLVVGNASFPQALVFQGSLTGVGCTSNPTVMNPNSTGLAAVSVPSGSWLSLQNVQTPSLPGATGLLAMDANSHLEVVIPVTYAPNSGVTEYYQLLRSAGSCPALTAVNVTVVNCPNDPSLALVGSYVCAFTALPNATSGCLFSLTIGGALVAQATNYLQLVMNKDCSALTQVTFKATIFGATGVPIAAIVITYWQCTSITAVMTVMGGTVAQAQSALLLVYNSALNGLLKTQLAVISATLITTPTPITTATTSYPYHYNYNYNNNYATTWSSASSSNPALLALLVLLVIPIAIIIGVLLWLCMRKREPEPCPMPKPICMSAPLYAPMGAPICPSVSAMSVVAPANSLAAAPLSPLTPPAVHCISPVRCISPSAFELADGTVVETVLGC